MRRLVDRPEALVLVFVLVGMVIGALVGPHAPRLGTPSGDPTLVAEARTALGTDVGRDRVSVAHIHGGEARWAGFGEVSQTSRFELGSITKTFTGLLLADAVERDEVGLDDPLEEHLPELAGSEAGTVTLAELASHRAGLPVVARMAPGDAFVSELANTTMREYTDTTPDDLITAAGTITLDGRGTMQYSNLGMSLLGHALARAAGVDGWATLADERIWQPLGMTQTLVAAPHHPAPDLIPTRRANGRDAEPWTGRGYAPAGVGVTTTAADLTRYAQALLDGTAPGMEALEARWDATMGMRIGLAWMTAEGPDGAVRWHNGGTGGTRTMLAIDHSTGEAAVVLANTSRDVTGAGIALVGASWPRAADTMFAVPWWLLAALTVITVALFVVSTLRHRPRAIQAVWGAAAVGWTLTGWAFGPWQTVPAWLWAGASAASVAAIGIGMTRRGPWWPNRRRWLTVVGLVVSGAILLAGTVSSVTALR